MYTDIPLPPPSLCPWSSGSQHPAHAARPVTSSIVELDMAMQTTGKVFIILPRFKAWTESSDHCMRFAFSFNDGDDRSVRTTLEQLEQFARTDALEKVWKSDKATVRRISSSSPAVFPVHPVDVYHKLVASGSNSVPPSFQLPRVTH